MKTEQISIADRQFSIPIKYCAGQRDLTAAEAAILQGAFRQNASSFLYGRAKGADALTDEDAAGLQLAAEEYASKHTFGVRVSRIGLPPPISPIDRKALSLIAEDIRTAIRKRDGSVAASADEIREKAKLVLAGPKGQTYRSEARAFFKRRETAQLDMFAGEEPQAPQAEAAE